MKRKVSFRRLPCVNEVLTAPGLVQTAARYDRRLVTHCVRLALVAARERLAAGDEAPVDTASLVSETLHQVEIIAGRRLRPVINATGVILHTNLGRAPLGAAAVAEVAAVCGGYSNLEFDLDRAERGSRMAHVREILKFLTSAEDVLVVNNNAAGILLALQALAKDREVVISRGELIEIGDSFRLPDIMAASGARMVEVGTTNRTRLADYAAAITPETRVLFKAHRSNFVIRGFTAEPTVAELAKLAHERGLHLVYDLGSGLLRQPKGMTLAEPDATTALGQGADVVAFSCDKLLGGPQAGVLAGSAELVSSMARSPLMRALRVGKLTLAALAPVCRGYLDGKGPVRSNPTLAMLGRAREEVRQSAVRAADCLAEAGIRTRVVESRGQCGGGSLPDVGIPSYAVEIVGHANGGSQRQTSALAERLFRRLLDGDRPVLAVLREGRLLLDILTVGDSDLAAMVAAVVAAVAAEAQA